MVCLCARVCFVCLCARACPCVFCVSVCFVSFVCMCVCVFCVWRQVRGEHLEAALRGVRPSLLRGAEVEVRPVRYVRPFGGPVRYD